MSRIFLLDTSVILYDSQALYNFQEHDVVVPLTVLEELDQFKKGNAVLNLQAREFLRELDRLSEAQDIRQWLPLDGDGHGRFRVVTDQPVPDLDAGGSSASARTTTGSSTRRCGSARRSPRGRWSWSRRTSTCG